MTDIVELLENLSVSPHQQSIIDSAVDEIVGLRKALREIVVLTGFEDASIKATEGNHTITGGNIGKFVEGK